jgi:hypothetical protein
MATDFIGAVLVIVVGVVVVNVLVWLSNAFDKQPRKEQARESPVDDEPGSTPRS